MCSLCAALVVGDERVCLACGATLELVRPDNDGTVLRSSLSNYPPPAPVISGIPPTAWPNDQTIVRGAQTPIANRHAAPLVQQAIAPTVAAKMPGSPQWVTRAAIALALLGTAGLTWLVIGRGDDAAQDSTTPTTLVDQTSIAAVAPSIEAATTLPATAVVEPITVAPAPPAVGFTPPPIPATPVFLGPGTAYSIADPLPSGVTSAQALPPLAVAQQMADLLAADQWESALLSLYFFDGETRTPTIEALQGQWGTADRLSLILLNATPEGGGYNLLLGTIANLQDGTTNVLCNHIYVEVVDRPAVVDLGNASMISQGESAFMPEQFLNDIARIDDLKARCV